MQQQVTLTRQAVRTPRAAAVAGIIFSVLFTTRRLAWDECRGMAPGQHDDDFAGAHVRAFCRHCLPVVHGRGALSPGRPGRPILFDRVLWQRLAFSGDDVRLRSAIAGGILSSYAIEADTLVKSGVVTFGCAIMYTITNVYGVRMAGVFMISLASIWMRTHVMPRVFVFLTYALALLLLVSSNLTLWLVLVFPAWVFVISVFILIISLRGERAVAEGVIGSHETSPMA